MAVLAGATLGLPMSSFLNNLCRQTLKQGNCHIQVGAGMCDSGPLRVALMVAYEVDGTALMVVHIAAAPESMALYV